MRRLVAVAIIVAGLAVAVPGWAAKVPKLKFDSGGRSVAYEVFGQDGEDVPVLLLLPGSSGPGEGFYRGEAKYFAGQGYTVLLLHYFDAARSERPGVENYQAWAGALRDLARLYAGDAGHRRAEFVVGYSLGGSVALAAGSQKLAVNGMAIWYGSLTDYFFYHLRGMPPLLILHGALDANIPVKNAEQLIRLCGLARFDCESHIYADQGHGFEPAVLEDARRRTLEFFAARGK